MQKNISYKDQLIKLSKLYKIDEVKNYIRSKKDLTVSQVELILLKNKIRLPEQSYNKKKIAEIKFKEQVITNIVLTACLLVFVISLISIRPYIKTITNEMKFTYVAKEYKSNFKSNKFPKNLNTQQDDNKKLENHAVSLDTQITLNLFENLKYDLKKIRQGQPVKPIYLSQLPKDLDRLKNTKKKKDTFIKIVMPLILDENNKILENRKKLFKILSKSTNSMGEKRWLKRRFKEYGIKKGDITELKVRMDIIPPSIAIAQAAIESGWGTSRFALEGNAMFGQWTWSKNGIEPTEKSKNQNHKILKFSMLRSSVKAYKNNLNTHNGYKEFREKRAELRKNNKKISGLKLVNYLYNYAATGKEYTKSLKRTIDQNGLTDFDDATLMNSGKSLPARASLIL
ncbi:MAG: glucosaminidase domain-containing protein [Pelagibacteraceae bacterium]|nr:glucosaminidase domain-containing protein [Pelagibacteraceae bacterium]